MFAKCPYLKLNSSANGAKNTATCSASPQPDDLAANAVYGLYQSAQPAPLQKNGRL